MKLMFTVRHDLLCRKGTKNLKAVKLRGFFHRYVTFSIAETALFTRGET